MKSHLSVQKMGVRKAQKLGFTSARLSSATDCPLQGVAGKWSACGWSVAQLDHDEELGPMHGMYGTLDAGLEVQRTIKRAELMAFLCLLRKAMGPTMYHVDNKGIIDGLWRGEMTCIGPKAKKNADLWISLWEELHTFRQKID